jgi:hypothetical protein
MTWNGGTVLKAANGSIVRGMTNAVIFLEGEARRLISRSNRGGDDPSAPGEPPKRVSGQLFAAVSHAVASDDSGVHGFIGVVKGSQANAYAARLEFGYQGTDSLGRNVNQAPRPWLRPTVLRNREKIVELIAKG